MVALVAVVARVGPSPWLPLAFLAFAGLYLALVPVGALRRPFGPGGRKTDAEDAADLAEAAARSLLAWEETASRAVAAWHLARETVLAKLANMGHKVELTSENAADVQESRSVDELQKAMELIDSTGM